MITIIGVAAILLVMTVLLALHQLGLERVLKALGSALWASGDAYAFYKKGLLREVQFLRRQDLWMRAFRTGVE